MLHIDTAKIPYNNGTLVLLGPNIPHSDFGNKELENNMEVVIQFDKEFVDEKIAVFPEFRRLKSLVKSARKVLLFGEKTKEELSKSFEKLDAQSVPDKLIHFMHILERLSRSPDFKTVFNEYSTTSSKSSDVERLESISNL